MFLRHAPAHRLVTPAVFDDTIACLLVFLLFLLPFLLLLAMRAAACLFSFDAFRRCHELLLMPRCLIARYVDCSLTSMVRMFTRRLILIVFLMPRFADDTLALDTYAMPLHAAYAMHVCLMLHIRLSLLMRDATPPLSIFAFLPLRY